MGAVHNPLASPPMILRLSLAVLITIALTGCDDPPATTVHSVPPPASLIQHIDKATTLRGSFSLGQKIIPYITVENTPIFLVGHLPAGWPDLYRSLEGRDVTATGTLRYRTYPHPAAADEPQPPDHLYFIASEVTIASNE